MKISIFFLLFTSVIFSQTTFFIKYKETVSFNEVEKKVQTQNLSLTSNSLNKSVLNFRVEFLSKGRWIEIEELKRIVKVTSLTNLTKNDLEILSADNPEIEYLQLANVYKINNTPNDSLVAQQWGLKKIDAFSAWNISEGKDSIIVAVIDTGIDYLHPDLTRKLFYNNGEIGTDNLGRDKKSNGIDDDRNGFIDDYQGWDFTDRVGFPFDPTGGDYLEWDNDPMDENNFSHGTAVAGIIGAETNNRIGIAGVAPKVRIMNLRAFDPAGYGEEDDVASAILYAVENGAKVINMSFGDYSFSYLLRDVIRYAYSKNLVLVASSGNSNSPNPHYPSGYSEVISVGNSTENDVVASSSNYGSSLDLVAPGSSIFTTARKNEYRSFSGTSAAAPFVSAAASLILSLKNFSNEEIKQIIKTTTDDIHETGWDLRSGAGRLNIFRALTILSPAIVKINYPTDDFATSFDTLKINATVINPYFQKYDLQFGVGLNPTSWNNLILSGTSQFISKNISEINLASFKDTSFTIRLVVYQTNGRTMEERINFHKITKAPLNELISLVPAYYGNSPTIMSAFYTNMPAIVRLYYREKNSSSGFNFFTLDGFTINNQFVKRLHYGFLPKMLSKPNTEYEIYFESENLVGLKSVLKDSVGNNFLVRTGNFLNNNSKREMAFKLPAGILFDEAVNITSNVKNEIYMRENTSPRYSTLYRMEGNSFSKVDSIHQQIVKDFGDFNKDGKKDLLTFWSRDSINILEQISPSSSKFQTKFQRRASTFWPIKVDDIDKNGNSEILIMTGDTTISVFRINNDLSLTLQNSFSNFSTRGYFNNTFDSPNAVVTDLNNDNKNEIWMIDSDGDILSWEVNSLMSIVPSKVISTGFIGSANNLSVGDFNGDGKKELAVLLQSVDELDIASYNLLIIFNFVNDKLNIIYTQAYVDPSDEFNSTFQRVGKDVRFADIDNDSKDELILFTFPYSYILKSDGNEVRYVYYEENVNSSTILVSDLNQNGIVEVAFPKEKEISFYEFGSVNAPEIPSNLIAYSLDESKIKLSWFSNQSNFYIYRGLSATTLTLYDSTNQFSYLDSNVALNNNYFYSVRSVNRNFLNIFSDHSQIVKAYHHKPAQMISAEVKSRNSIKINFSDKINTTIENLQAFFIVDSIGDRRYPNSISPATQTSYLITFSKNFNVGFNKISLSNIRDFYFSPIKSDTLTFFFNPTAIEENLFVTSHEILNSYLIKIKFNLEVDPTNINSASNFVFNPANKISGVRIDETDKTIIYVDLKGGNAIGAVGREYRLELRNIRSSIATGNLSLRDGAGSTLVLTAFSSNLDDVYVYPNPFKISENNSSITFAGLPKRVEIIVFNLSGLKLKTLRETDGDGGINWNLIADDGNLLSSGIYLYRVAILDDFNEEKEIKFDKFVIIR